MMKMKYQDILLSPKERAKDLLSRMTIKEKVAQLQCYNPKDKNAPNLDDYFTESVGAVSYLNAAWLESKEDIIDNIFKDQKTIMEKSRFNIPALFHMEGLTGALMPEATSFPTGIGRGAAWNIDLEKDAANIIGREMKSVGIRHSLAPVLDVTRDARLGRYGESYSEDSTLVSAIGTAYVEGLQNSGENGEYSVMATAKHFLGYHAGMGGIHAAASNITSRELRETFATPFQAAIKDGNLKSIMNQYGSIDGVPATASYELLQNLLRKEMDFTGILVSDYASIEELVSRVKIAENKIEATKIALNCGFDIEMPTPYAYDDDMEKLILNGEINEDLLNESVLRVLKEKFELGLFENPYPLKKQEVTKVFNNKKSNSKSLQYARESIVLLKNDGILPFKAEGKKIAIIGHLGKSIRSYFGGYSYMSVLELAMGGRNTMAGIEVQSKGDKLWKEKKKDKYPGSMIDVEIPGLEKVASKAYPQCKNIYEEFKTTCKNSEIFYEYGYPYVGNDISRHEEALKLSKKSDFVVVTVGGKYGWGTACSTGEGIDSGNINLPECQEQFMVKLGQAGIPFIVVHMDGRPISSDAADQYASAIIEAWNLGEYGGKAIVESILGINNPSGKLPVTVAYNSSQAPLYYNHPVGSSYHVGTSTPFKSYIDIPHTPRYHFGYGLSFTTFNYKRLKLNKNRINPYENFIISMDLENTGELDGQEIIQIYIRDIVSSMVKPEKKLIGFKKIFLKKNSEKTIEFLINPTQFSFLDINNNWKIESGEYEVLVGSSSNNIHLKEIINITKDGYTQSKNRKFYSY